MVLAKQHPVLPAPWISPKVPTPLPASVCLARLLVHSREPCQGRAEGSDLYRVWVTPELGLTQDLPTCGPDGSSFKKFLIPII